MRIIWFWILPLIIFLTPFGITAWSIYLILDGRWIYGLVGLLLGFLVYRWMVLQFNPALEGTAGLVGKIVNPKGHLKPSPQTYTSKKYGFSIDCPPGWKVGAVDTAKDPAIAFYTLNLSAVLDEPRQRKANRLSEIGSWAILTVFTWPTNIKQLDELKSSIKRKIEESENSLVTENIIKVAGLQAMKVGYNTDDPPVLTEEICFIKGGNEFHIKCEAPSKHFWKFRSTFNASVRSLNFKT